MFMCIVNSEEEYLDLIADLSRYGLHQPNLYAKDADEDGMSVCDSFIRLSPNMAEDYLGVRDYKWEVTVETDEDGKEWEVEPLCEEGPLNRSSLHFCPELQKYLLTPKQEDYPIFIMWEWADDFDRMGSIKTRYFDWISLAAIPYSHKDEYSILKQQAILWQDRYAQKI